MGTVPMLTPADTAIWDDELLEQIAENFADDPMCDNAKLGCENRADYVLVSTCCRTLIRLYCGTCLRFLELWWDLPTDLDRVTCSRCDHDFGRGARVSDVLQVVRL